MNYQQAKTRAEALAFINMAERISVRFAMATSSYIPDIQVTKAEARRVVPLHDLPSDSVGTVTMTSDEESTHVVIFYYT